MPIYGYFSNIFSEKKNLKMKPKTKVKPKEKRMQYDAENLKKAINAVNSGMSKKQAAKQFQVPRSTIQFRINNPDKINPRPGPSTVLTESEEKDIVNWIVQSSKKGFPRRKEDIQHSVSVFIKKSNRSSCFTDNCPGEKWLKLFLKRHPEISIRTPESVTAASSVVSEKDIRGWFNGIEKYLKDNEYFDILSDPSRVFNGDETNFLLCPKTGVVLALKGDKNIYEIDRGQAKSAITVMFTFCANGDTTPPMVILPYKRLPGEIASKVPKEWGIGLSDNGWMKAELFYDYIKNVLHPYLVKEGKIFPVILFVDGHKTHLTLQVSELCSDLGIILIALYPNCTRILQPADVAAFFPLKCAWKQCVLRWRRDHPAQALTKTEFVPILKTAIEVSLKSDTIKNGFRACGLQPWNADALDYTKCLGDSKGKQTSQTLPTNKTSENDPQHPKPMTRNDFINIVSWDTIDKLNRKEEQTIHDASKLLQNLWHFFGDVLDAATIETSNDIPMNSLLQEQQLDIENMPVVMASDLSESDCETSHLTVSHEVEVHSTHRSFEPNLPSDLKISPQPTDVSPHLHISKEGIEYDKDSETVETQIVNSPDVLNEPPTPSNKINIQSSVLTENIIYPSWTPKTPCKLNLTPVKLNDILILPKTPIRKGTKNSERTSFVLTSEEWQRKETEKKMAKEQKEEGIKKRRLEREQKKLSQKDKKPLPVKGKGGKGRKGKVDNTPEHIDYNVPSTSRCKTTKNFFTETDILKMLADSDDEM